MYTIGGELYHHGVLGMKWGVRRYQPYGTGYQGKTKGKFIRTKLANALKERNEARNYNYKKHADYQNADRKSKSAQTNQYSKAEMMVGKRGANKIEYRVREKGADRQKEYKKAVAKAVVKGVATTALVYAAASAVTRMAINGPETPRFIANAKKYINTNNYVTDCLKTKLDLKEYSKRGITTGRDTIERGKKLLKRMNDLRHR